MFGLQNILKQLQQLQQQLNRLTVFLQTAEETKRESAQTLSDGLSALCTAANRHDMAIEDLLDSWEELQAEQREEVRDLRGAQTEALQQEVRERTEREDALLRLVVSYHDQLFALSRAASAVQDARWERQLSLVSEKLSAGRMAEGLQTVDAPLVPVDYALHTVREVVETQDPALDGRVAELYSCGYLYRGRMLRKAQVSAYRYPGRPEGADGTAARDAGNGAEAGAAAAGTAGEGARA